MATTGTGSTKLAKTGYRLSPNEEAALIKQEKERRRKLRIQQVREQERNFASKIRSNVSKKKGEELKNLALNLRQDWEREKEEKTQALQKMFERSLGSVGDGHRAAKSQPPLAEIRAAQSVRDQHAANQRYNSALKKNQQVTEEQYQKENAHILARKSAIQAEKARAARIASLPPPAKDPLEELDDDGKENQVVTVISGFSTSHYHLKGEYVERAEPHEQEDARAAAQEAERRSREERAEEEQEEKERREKAQLRHQHARKEELLHQDYNKLMVELGQMEQADRRRRQAIVANIPHQVFQPPHKRLEDKQEEQLKLEQAFEDMYMANTDYTGDLILALEPKPRGDTDLDITLDSVSDDVGVSLQPIPMPPPEQDAVARRFPKGMDEEEEGEDEERVVVEETQRQPRAPLKTLMNRIRNQREQMKKKVQLEVPRPADDRPGVDSETPSSSRDLAERDMPSPSPGDSSEVSESERSTVDTLETGTLSGDTNEQENRPSVVDEEKMTLLHPMEEAARIRSSIKIPDVQQQKRDIQEIMTKEDEQRLKLTEQQLQDHIQHRDHLQTLQDNLLQRQRLLQQQIEEQQRQHREQLLLQRELGQQQVGLQSSDLLRQQQIPMQVQREPQHLQEIGPQQFLPEQKYERDILQQDQDRPQQVHQQDLAQQSVHPIRRLIKQLQVADQQRQQQRQQQQQQMAQQPGHQPDLTQYLELPDQLLLQQQQKQLPDQHVHPRQQQFSQHLPIPLTAADFQMPEPWHSHPSERDSPTHDFQEIDRIGQPERFQDVQQADSESQPVPLGHPDRSELDLLDTSSYQNPAKIIQRHSQEFLQHYRPQDDISAAARQSQSAPDLDRRQLPSRDTLQEAQAQLQQRRERLMQLYPELKLPPYEPYIKDDFSPSSTRPTSEVLTGKPTQQKLPHYEHSIQDGVPLAYAQPPSNALPEKPPQPDLHILKDIEMRDYGKQPVNNLGGGQETTGDKRWVLPSLSFGEDVPISALEAPKPKPTASVSVSSTVTGVSDSGGPGASTRTRGLSDMERQLEQHRQQLLKTRQQLQQQQQQQQQRILNKQRVLVQRIEQQKQEQLARQHTEVQPHEMMTSQDGAQIMMTSQLSPQDVPWLQSGAHKLVTSEAHELMTSYSDVPSKMSAGYVDGEVAKASPTSELEEIQQKLSEISPEGTYKLPTMTFGQTVYQFDPREDSQISEEGAPSFQQLSPDSSHSHSENSDHLSETAASPQGVPATTSAYSLSASGGIRLLSQPLQYDWQTVLSSALDHPKTEAPVQSAVLPPMRGHSRPPPAPLRLPQPVEEAAPHELSTIIEVESPGAERSSRGPSKMKPVASTPHKSVSRHPEYKQLDADNKNHPFSHQYSQDVPSEPGDMASKMAPETDEVSDRYFSRTSAVGGNLKSDSIQADTQGHHKVSTSVPLYSSDVGRGVLSYPSSRLMSTGAISPVTMASTAPIPTSSLSLAPTTSPAVIHIASPSTDNGDASSHPDSSSVSMLSEHTLPLAQRSLGSTPPSEKSMERFMALSAYDSSTSDSVSSSNGLFHLRKLRNDKHSSKKSPIIKDFVAGIPSGIPWQSSLQPFSPPVTDAPEDPVLITTAAHRQSMVSTEYNLGPVSPQSIWTDTDIQGGSYLDGQQLVLPVFKRQDVPQNGLPVFSDVSISHYNTSFESGSSALPISAMGPVPVQGHLSGQDSIRVFPSGVSPRGDSEEWFLPHHSLDVSGHQQLSGGATLAHSLTRTDHQDVKLSEIMDGEVSSRPVLVETDKETDGESSKLSYAGALVEESNDAGESADDTLQEAMRNVAISESETSKETGIMEDPDLTLISLNTTLTSSVVSQDDVVKDEEQELGQWELEELPSDSLTSFLHHEEEMSSESPVRSGSDQSEVAGTGSLAIPASDTSSEDRPASLQEAFGRHKQAFILSSHSRQLEVKVHAQTQKATAFSQTLDNWKKSRGGKVQRAGKIRTGGSLSNGEKERNERPAVQGSARGPRGSSSGEKPQSKARPKKHTTVTASDRKAEEKEMHQRNMKLYNRLEEVQTKKLVQQRQKDYAANRQRRKEFELKLQARLNKLSKPASS